MNQTIGLEINAKRQPQTLATTPKQDVRERPSTTASAPPQSRGAGSSRKDEQPAVSGNEEQDKNAMRNRLLVESQADVARLTRENQELRIEMHKLKKRSKWQEERLRYSGNAGKRRADAEIDVYRRQNRSLSQQIEDLKHELAMEKKKLSQIESGDKLANWIRNNKYPIIHSIETRKKLLQQTMGQLVEKHKQKAAREAALGPVFNRKHPLVRRKPTRDEQSLHSIRSDLALYTNIEEFIHGILDSYHKLALENQKSKKEMEDDKLLRTGKINSLMRLAHVRKHGVLMGFQKTMKSSQSKKNGSLNRHSLSTTSLVSNASAASGGGSVTSMLGKSGLGYKGATDNSKAAWARCAQCSMYNSIKSLRCASCQSEEMEKIEM
eukprot:g1582.t1